MLASLIFLCGCVIKSKKEIIRDNDAEMMFNGAKNLLWIADDSQKILLEKYDEEYDRTYLASSVEDPSETVIVRFYNWKDGTPIPNEETYIVSGTIINTTPRKGKRIYYYQLLTFDPLKNVWTTWNFSPPDDKEIVVNNIAELKKAFKMMIEEKYFKRKEQLAFRVATDFGGEAAPSQGIQKNQGGGKN